MPIQRKPRARPPTRQPPPDPRDPPTVAEVRAIRAQMWREAGGTVAGMLALIRQEAGKRSNPRTTERPRTVTRRRG
jgi:hypothetical protein